MYELILDDDPVEVRSALLEEILALRHAELRAGLPVEAARFDGDRDPAARHFGAFHTGVNVGCASFLPSEWDGRPACQLRGMATRADYVGRGVGSALLRFAERALMEQAGVKRLWCNARLHAVPFYRKHGWAVVSEPFDIPTVGPHYRMFKG